MSRGSNFRFCVRFRYFFSLSVFFLIFIVSSSSVIAVSSDGSFITHEDYLASRIMAHVKIKGSRVYFSSNGLGSSWRDTLDACESLYKLGLTDVVLTDKLRDGIKNFVLSERVIVPLYASSPSVAFSGSNVSVVSANTSRVVIGEKYDSWWGNIKRSIEALRILDLIGRSSVDLVESVRNYTLVRMKSDGVHLLVGAEGWEATYWALFQAREWGYFDLLSDLGLPLISMEQIQRSRQPVSIDDAVLDSLDVFVTKIQETNLSLSAKLKQMNFSASILDLSLPTLFELGVNNDIYRTLPKLQLALDHEDRDYAIANDILFNRTVNRSYSVTGPDGSIVFDDSGDPVLIEESELVEELDYPKLDFFLDFNLTAGFNHSLGYTYEILDSEAQTLVIDLTNLRNFQHFLLQFNTYQIVHQPVVNWRYNLDANDSSLLASLNESFILQQSLPDANKSFTFREYIRDYPVLFEYLYHNEKVTTWLEKRVPIPLNFSLHLRTPAFSYLTVNPPKDGNYFLNTSDGRDYDLWIYNPSSDLSWFDLESNNGFFHNVLIDGYGSLGISNFTHETYNVFLFPLGNGSLATGAPFTLEARSVKKDYSVINPLTKYVDLFNRSLTGLDDLISGMEFLYSLTSDMDLSTLVNTTRLAELALYHYNITNRLFDEDYELTYKTWRVLDFFGLSEKLFSRRDYDFVLMSYFNSSYEESYNTRTKTLTGIRVLRHKNELSRELYDTRVYIDLLTYTNDWGATGDLFGFDDVGFGIYDRHVGSMTEYYAYQQAYGRIQQQMYDIYGQDLTRMMEDTSLPIMLQDSRFLSRDKMYWLTEPHPLSLADYFVNLAVLVFALICVLVGLMRKGTTRNLLLAVLVVVFILVQSLSTPIITNGFARSIQQYITFMFVFVSMLEDQLYDICDRLGNIGGTVVERPSIIDMQDELDVSSGTECLSMQRNKSRTLRVAYHDYLLDYLDVKSRWNKLYSSNGGTFIRTYPEPKLSYQGFVQQYGRLGMSQYAASQAAKYQKESEIRAERARQRLSYYSSASSFGAVADGVGGLFSSRMLYDGAIALLGMGGALGKAGVLMRNIPAAINNDLALPARLQTSPLVDDILGLISQTPQFSRYLSDDQLFVGRDFFISSQYYPVLEYLNKFHPVTERDRYLKMDLLTLVTSQFMGQTPKRRGVLGGSEVSSKIPSLGGSKKPDKSEILEFKDVVVIPETKEEDMTNLARSNNMVQLDDFTLVTRNPNDFQRLFDLWAGSDVNCSII